MLRRDVVRLLVLPALLLVCVSGAVFTLAKLHLAQPKAATATGPIRLGNQTAGAAIFRSTCAGCHGTDARGGIGPRLAGSQLPLARIKEQIDNGGGTMPAHLVTGRREEDVLAYLAKIVAPGSR